MKAVLKIKKISDALFEIAAEGTMHVPLHIVASETILEKMQQDLCLQQGMNVATLPGIYNHAVMMPDGHQGYGFPIGGVAAFDLHKGCISPGGIGYDIGCSVSLLACNLDREQVEPKIYDLLEFLFQRVPCGVGENSTLRLSFDDLDQLLNTGMQYAIKKGFATKDDRECTEEYGCMEEADAAKISQKAKERGKNQLGTLGAGNHFLEVQIVDEIRRPEIAEIFGITHVGQICVMVHCGSRGLGHQTCTDYLRIAETRFPDITRGLVDRELAYFPADSQEARDYFSAMSAAANFAFVNHRVICWNIRQAFCEVFDDRAELKLVYHIAHNMAKMEEHVIDGRPVKVSVHRKGATRALPPGHRENPPCYMETGHPILIPGSMGTASYVLAGTEKALSETFASTPHGAGRLMSRHEANRKYRGEKLKSELEYQGIYLRSASWRGISEEAPGAYKDVDEVARISEEAGIGNIVVRLKPLGVIKG